MLLGPVADAAAQPNPPAPGQDPALAFLLPLALTSTGLALGEAARRDGTLELPDTSVMGGAGVALAVLGPSAGHVYAGERGHALVTAVVRTAGLGALALGRDRARGIPRDERTTTDRALIIGGALVYAGATLYALADAPRAAVRATPASTGLTPTALVTGAGLAPGLAMAGRF